MGVLNFQMAAGSGRRRGESNVVLGHVMNASIVTFCSRDRDRVDVDPLNSLSLARCDHSNHQPGGFTFVARVKTQSLARVDDRHIRDF